MKAKPKVMEPGTVHNMGGDTKAYLGHFRKADTMRKGHNQGNPTGQDAGMQMSNPMPAPTGVSATPPKLGGGMTSSPPLSSFAAGKATGVPKLGGGGKLPALANPLKNPIRATRQQNRADVAAAKMAGGNVKAVRKQNRADLREAIGVRQSMNKANAATAKANLKQSTAGVKAARGALRTALAGRRATKTGLGSLVM